MPCKRLTIEEFNNLPPGTPGFYNESLCQCCSPNTYPWEPTIYIRDTVSWTTNSSTPTPCDRTTGFFTGGRTRQEYITPVKNTGPKLGLPHWTSTSASVGSINIFNDTGNYTPPTVVEMNPGYEAGDLQFNPNIGWVFRQTRTQITYWQDSGSTAIPGTYAARPIYKGSFRYVQCKWTLYECQNNTLVDLTSQAVKRVVPNSGSQDGKVLVGIGSVEQIGGNNNDRLANIVRYFLVENPLDFSISLTDFPDTVIDNSHWPNDGGTFSATIGSYDDPPNFAPLSLPPGTFSNSTCSFNYQFEHPPTDRRNGEPFIYTL